jgi:hypothetical protein
MPGSHAVAVLQEGYRSAERSTEVAVGQLARVKLSLEPLEVAGRLRIEAAALAGAQLIVDGAPVGIVPWEGTLEPGDHWFQLVRGDVGTAPALVTVVKGQTVVMDAQLVPLGPEVNVATKPSTATLRLGEAVLGAGRWRGRLPVGRHVLAVAEEGYHATTHPVTVTADGPRTVAVELEVDESHPRWGVVEGSFFADVVGGFAIAPTYGSRFESDYQRDGAESFRSTTTSNPAALGGLGMLRVGYEFPFRVSLSIGGGYLWTQKRFTRSVQTSVPQGGEAAQYLNDEVLRYTGAMAAAGIGYRQPLVGPLELQGHVMVGAFFAFVDYEVEGALESAAGSANLVPHESSGDVSANLVVLPQVELALRFDDFSAGAGLTVAGFVLEGPSALRDEDLGVQVEGADQCRGTVSSSDPRCAMVSQLADGNTYDAFVAWIPSVRAGYAF